MSEKGCWIILPKMVNSQYRSETLRKQVSLQAFWNYCSNILVVGLVVISQGFLSDFSRSRSSDLKVFCKKIVFNKFQNSKKKTVVSESSFKVAEYFKKKTLEQVFLCKFHKILKKYFVEAVLRSSTKVCFWNS